MKIKRESISRSKYFIIYFHQYYNLTWKLKEKACPSVNNAYQKSNQQVSKWIYKVYLPLIEKEKEVPLKYSKEYNDVSCQMHVRYIELQHESVCNKEWKDLLKGTNYIITGDSISLKAKSYLISHYETFLPTWCYISIYASMATHHDYYIFILLLAPQLKKEFSFSSIFLHLITAVKFEVLLWISLQSTPKLKKLSEET